MWVVIILAVIAVIIGVLAKKSAEKAKQERLEKERLEKKQKAAAEAKAQKEKYEIITEAEKEKLSSDEDKELLKVALDAFNKAVNGNVDAMLWMGYTYRLKLNNSIKSAYWIQKASNAGSVDAKYWLGQYCMNGYGVKQNKTRGTGMILEAAKKGNELAIKSLIEEFNMPKDQMRALGIPV